MVTKVKRNENFVEKESKKSFIFTGLKKGKNMLFSL